jgi:HSP20 family protein
MFLTKWTPRNSHNTLWDVFEKDFFPTRRLSEIEHEAVRRPLTNIRETEDGYMITLEMPGVAKKEVEVALEGNTLTITGERTDKLEDKGLLRKEIREEKFSRSFKLDETIDRDKVKAKMENGILTVNLPKVEKEIGRKVDID